MTIMLMEHTPTTYSHLAELTKIFNWFLKMDLTISFLYICIVKRCRAGKRWRFLILKYYHRWAVLWNSRGNLIFWLKPFSWGSVLLSICICDSSERTIISSLLIIEICNDGMMIFRLLLIVGWFWALKWVKLPLSLLVIWSALGIVWISWSALQRWCSYL